MRIRVINPNTTASMTETIGRAAVEAAAAGTVIEAVTSPTGPVSIEGYVDEALCLPGLLIEVRRAEADAVDGIVIACFDDTGLDAARQIAQAPIVGIGEAAYHAATLIAHRFTVVTTLARSIPALEHNLTRYGFDRRAVVRAAEVPVLALEDETSDARARIDAEIERALRDDRAEAIVLGCAGMAKLARDLAQKHRCPVIDGVGAAVKLVEMLASLGLKTSKIGAYAATPPKQVTGALAALAR
ncbi:MAG TPA: aspartate/glutamate racemase family protein [Vineibacter sp.]|nr:aspartate/glutamate racemase family protein [Vineibacter sp.]